VGLPPRIAIPVLIIFAVLFLGVIGGLLRVGFGTTGSAFGPNGGTDQGDARLQATPVPIGAEPPGTFTVPQTGTGRTAGAPSLPGAGVGGGTPAGPPAAVMQEVRALRARIADNPNDVVALCRLGDLEMDAARFQAASDEYERALRAIPNYPPALYGDAVALQNLGRRTDAIMHYRRYIRTVGRGASHADDARAALRSLGG